MDKPGFPNLLVGEVPDTDDGQGEVVTCAYFIDELEHVVECMVIAPLNKPI